MKSNKKCKFIPKSLLTFAVMEFKHILLFFMILFLFSLQFVNSY